MSQMPPPIIVDHACKNCGAPVPKGAPNCPNCGAKQGPRSIWSSGIFWVFVIIGVPALAFGTCCLLAGSGLATGPNNGPPGADNRAWGTLLLFLSVPALLLFFGLLAGLIWSRRRR